MNKNKVSTSIGIDGITCSVLGKLVEREQKYPAEAEKPLLHISPNGNNTQIAVVLPRFIRNDNKKGFGMKDLKQLDDVIQYAERILKHSFKRDLTDLVVCSVEVAITTDLNIIDETLINNLMSFMSRVLLDVELKRENNKTVYLPQNKFVTGKRRTGCVYIKDEIVKSFETATLPNKRLKIKCYSKGANSSFGGTSSIWRLEFVYNDRGIRYITKKEDVRLSDILHTNIIKKFINQCKLDYSEIVAPKVKGYLKEVVRVLHLNLKQNKRPYDVLILNRDITYDIAVFEKALKKFYKEQNKTETAYRKMISRVKKRLAEENDISISSGMIEIFEDITKKINE